MIIFSKVLLRKLLYHSYVKVSSRELRDTLSILKDTLWLKILLTWIKICANSFIKTLVNDMKRKSTEVSWTLSLTKKNPTPHFKEHCTKIDISPVAIHFFFSQTKLVFKYNPLFIDMLNIFLQQFIYIFTFCFLHLFYGFWSLFNASTPFL